MMGFFKKKFYVIWVRKEEGGYEYHKKQRIYFKKEIMLKKGLILDTSKPFYRKRLKTYYFVDEESGQLFFDGEQEISKEDVKDLFKRGIIRQLSSNIMGAGWRVSILTLLLGGIVGFFICAFVYNQGWL